MINLALIRGGKVFPSSWLQDKYKICLHYNNHSMPKEWFYKRNKFIWLFFKLTAQPSHKPKTYYWTGVSCRYVHGAVVLKVCWAIASPWGLVQTQMTGPHPQSSGSQSGGLGSASLLSPRADLQPGAFQPRPMGGLQKVHKCNTFCLYTLLEKERENQ